MKRFDFVIFACTFLLLTIHPWKSLNVIHEQIQNLQLRSEQLFYDKNQLKSKFLQVVFKQMMLIYKLY